MKGISYSCEDACYGQDCFLRADPGELGGRGRVLCEAGHLGLQGLCPWASESAKAGWGEMCGCISIAKNASEIRIPRVQIFNPALPVFAVPMSSSSNIRTVQIQVHLSNPQKWETGKLPNVGSLEKTCPVSFLTYKW